MRIKRIGEWNLTGVAGQEIEIPACRAAGLSITYRGTNGAGATLALANIGLHRLTYMGEPKANVRAVTLFQYDDLKGGLPPFASAVGAAFRTTYHLPFRFGGYDTDNPDDNVMNVQHGQMRLWCPGPVTAVALPAACFVEVGVIEDPSGNARYTPYVWDTQHTLTAAYPVKITGPNVRAVLMQRPVGVATLPASLQFKMAGQSVLEGPWQMIEDNTNIYNKIEAAAILALLAEFGNGNPASWQGGRYDLLIVGANAGDTMWISEFGAQSVRASEFLRTRDAAVSDLIHFNAASESPAQAIVAPAVPSKIPSQSDSGSTIPAGRTQISAMDPGTSPNVPASFESV